MPFGETQIYGKRKKEKRKLMKRGLESFLWQLQKRV